MLGDMPRLKTLLDQEGQLMLARAKQLTDDDAAVVGALVTDPAARAVANSARERACRGGPPVDASCRSLDRALVL